VRARTVLFAHRQDVAQGVPIALDLQEGLLVRADRLLVVQRRRRVVLADLVSLDAVRAPDGTRERGATQAALTPLQRAQHMAQVFAHAVNLRQHGAILARQRRCEVDRGMSR
jgi:hypothetical protein